jgi:hypothetical protein
VRRGAFLPLVVELPAKSSSDEVRIGASPGGLKLPNTPFFVQFDAKFRSLSDIAGTLGALRPLKPMTDTLGYNCGTSPI